MTFHHKLMRATTETMINNLIRDLRSDTKRSLQKGIDICLYFSKNQVQREIYQLISGIAKDPHHPYNRLINRKLNEIDEQVVKTACVNLGYTTFHYGARQIESGGGRDFWIEPLIAPATIESRKERGVYTYFCRAADTPSLSAAAERNPECTFFVLLTDSSQAPLSPNVIPLLDVEGDFSLFREQQRLYGFSTRSPDISESLALAMAEKGCFFGVYVGDNARAKPYTGFAKLHLKLPVVLFDYYNDAALIQEIILRRQIPPVSVAHAT